MEGFDLIQDLAVVLLIAGVAGWMARRAGLSAVVGYLAAGLIIGPNTPPFSLVLDEGQVRTLAQLGLVFLMFSMGMGLSLGRLRRLGAPLVLATVLGAILILNACRAIGLLAGWTHAESLCIAGMLMVSSSAIIGKAVAECGLAHERAGQLAMGITVIEDAVAVAMLAYIGTLGGHEATGTAPVFQILGILAGFVALVLVLGLLVVPRLLRPAMKYGGIEIVTLLLAGVMFGLAVLAVHAGYSPALGAFLLGAIVAEGPLRAKVDRAFGGLRDTFTGVFFVAVGMTIAPRAVAENWAWILGLSALALLGRPLACGVSLLAVGTPIAVAVRTALCVTAIGEFSLVIAQLGVSEGVLSPRFSAIAVGVSVVTVLASSCLSRWGGGVAAAAEAWQPVTVRSFLNSWAEWLGTLEAQGRSSVLWRMIRGRMVQIAVEVLLVSGLLAFSPSIEEAIASWVVPRPENAMWFHVTFWLGLGLAVAGPLLAIWRNAATLAMVAAEMAASAPGNPRARPVIESALRILAGVTMGIWLWTLLPFRGAALWVLALAAAAFLFMVMFLGRRLTRWHHRVEMAVHEALGHFDAKGRPALGTRFEEVGAWNIHLEECELPDHAACAGQSLAEFDLRRRFGCSVVRVDHQGFVVFQPPPGTSLYPGDRLLLAGTEEQIAAARSALVAERKGERPCGAEDIHLQTVRILAGGGYLGETLATLTPLRETGVQVLGIRRDLERVVNPSGTETLRAGDELLVLGSPAQVLRFSERLRRGGRAIEGG
ncbi:MAG: cation:proton antiporter [Verrucomicrobiia bacterium]